MQGGKNCWRHAHTADRTVSFGCMWVDSDVLPQWWFVFHMLYCTVVTRPAPSLLSLVTDSRHPHHHTLLSVTVEFLRSAVFQVMEPLHCQLVDAAVEFVADKLRDRSR